MKTVNSILSLILLMLASMPTASAQKSASPGEVDLIDSVSIAFGSARWDIDRTLGNNAAVLDGIRDRLTNVRNDSLYSLRKVTVFGGSSPDGSVEINNKLSRQRADALFDWFDKWNQLSDVDKSFILLGRDWAGTLRLASQDASLPYKEETLELLQTIVAEKEALNGKEPANSLQRLQRLRGGVPYLYLYNNIFPRVRESKLIVGYEKIPAPEIEVLETNTLEVVEMDSIPAPIDTIAEAEEVVVERDVVPGKNFYMDIRSNMLYDALVLPNIGVDFYLGKNISVGANWLYGWWKSHSRFRYWRAYGGELNARWWFGKAAHRKPLTGHHLGVYGQVYTYDFQWGGKGEMGGEPGGNLWDRCLWSAGVEYGFSLPVARRINIDFSLGVGYTEGTYYKYKPNEGHNVWLSTHKRHYFGPTKLEIAFVWLIGNGNYNEKKGGKR